MNSVLAILPARFGSTRFPGKPLVSIQGKPMIQRVFEQVRQCPSITAIRIATDDLRIAEEGARFGAKVVMTSPDCASGTDRCAEVLKMEKEAFDLVINVQGDEPFIRPEQIEELISILISTGADIGTLCRKIELAEDVFNPNVVKCVKSSSHKALYFSRNPIPFVRGADPETWINKAHFFKHIGLYGYKAEVLPLLSALNQSMLETAESLEQLRWLEAGYSIAMGETSFESIGIDTPEDLTKAEAWLQEHPEF
jgi:3-deoxy-manno-octulosonate cytidylyltransferase (CMP-KDO synthetase)